MDLFTGSNKIFSDIKRDNRVFTCPKGISTDIDVATRITNGVFYIGPTDINGVLTCPNRIYTGIKVFTCRNRVFTP